MTTQTPAEVEKWLRIRVWFFPNFWLRVRKKNTEFSRSRLRLSGSGPASVPHPFLWKRRSHTSFFSTTALSTIYKFLVPAIQILLGLDSPCYKHCKLTFTSLWYQQPVDGTTSDGHASTEETTPVRINRNLTTTDLHHSNRETQMRCDVDWSDRKAMSPLEQKRQAARQRKSMKRFINTMRTISIKIF